MPQVVSSFPNLRELDLSNNHILEVYGYNISIIGIGGIQALSTYLPKLTRLQSLRASQNGPLMFPISLPAELIAFPQVIGQLKNLQTLDFSYQELLYAGSLGKGLENIHSLKSINLANACYYDIESDTGQGALQLIQGLQAQPDLKHLDLSSNLIGLTSYGYNKDPNSTFALANALNSWPQLKSLNLGMNYIGYEDPASASFFLEKLAELATTVNKQGRTLEVNLVNGIFNVDWTQGAQVLQKLTQQKILGACARELCTGDPIPKPKPSATQAHGFQEEWGPVLVTTSDATSSRQVPWYSPVKWVMAWKSWWEEPTQPIDMNNQQIKALVKLQGKCDHLIDKADTQNADRWYRFSLEDLREDVKEMVKYPTEVNEDTIKHFYRRLEGIERDFLRKPLVEKPSFFGNSDPLTTRLTESHNPIDLWFVSRPLLEVGTAPLVLGEYTEV